VGREAAVGREKPFSTADVNALTLVSIKEQLRNLPGYTYMAWGDAAEWLLDRKYELNLALKWVDQSVSIRPMFGNFELKSRILTALGKEDEAGKVRTQALAMASVQEAYSYARQQQIAGKQKEGLAILRDLSTKDPNNWICHLAKARVLSSEKKFAEAAKEVRIALEGTPALMKVQIQRLVDRLERARISI
jgi:tetratricopeptide (TPR) repeat protein